LLPCFEGKSTVGPRRGCALVATVVDGVALAFWADACHEAKRAVLRVVFRDDRMANQLT